MDDHSDVLVQMRHIRHLYCSRGAKRLGEHLGFNWLDFVKNGITADKLLATGDEMARRLAMIAIEEKQNGRR